MIDQNAYIRNYHCCQYLEIRVQSALGLKCDRKSNNPWTKSTDKFLRFYYQENPRHGRIAMNTWITSHVFYFAFSLLTNGLHSLEYHVVSCHSMKLIVSISCIYLIYKIIIQLLASELVVTYDKKKIYR